MIFKKIWRRFIRNQMEKEGNKLCQCQGTRKIIPIGRWDRCPLEGKAHTSFYVFQCEICKGITGFPEENFELALEKGTGEVKKKLEEIIHGKRHGWIIDQDSLKEKRREGAPNTAVAGSNPAPGNSIIE